MMLFSTLTYADGFWRFKDEFECETTKRCDLAVADGLMRRKQWGWAGRTVVLYTTTKKGKDYISAYIKRANENYARALDAANLAKKKETK